MKYSKHFGEQIRTKELPNFSKKGIQKMLNIVYIESVQLGLKKSKHLLDSNNIPNYDFLISELDKEMKVITGGLTPQLLYHELSLYE